MRIFHPANRILWCEAIGFTAIIGISWANELGGFARHLLGGQYAMNWQDAAVQTAITLLAAAPTIYLTARISRRLKYLEGFLRLCSWCRKVGHQSDWISIEKFLEENFDTKTTHGICPDCVEMVREKEMGL